MRLSDQMTGYARNLTGQGLVALAVLLLARRAFDPPGIAALQRGAGSAASATAAAEPPLLFSDPFDPWVRPADPKKTPTLCAEIDDFARRGDANAVELLVVHCAGGESPDAIETRGRSRRAATQALFAAGYHPDPLSELHFVRVGGDSSASYRCEWFVDDLTTSSLVSEQHEQPASSAKAVMTPVLVAWFDEGEAQGQISSRWAEIVAAAGSCKSAGVHVRVSIIGPTDSDALVSLALEREVEGGRIRAMTSIVPGPDAADARNGREVVSIYSSSATARIEAWSQSDVLLCDFGPEFVGEIQRTIGDDDWLAEIALAELVQRLPELRRSDDELPALGTDALSPFMWAGWVAQKLGLTPPAPERVKIGVLYPPETEYGRRLVGSLERAATRLWQNAPAGTPKIELVKLFAPDRIAGRSALRQSDGQIEIRASGEQQLDSIEQLVHQIGAHGELRAFILALSSVEDRLVVTELLNSSRKAQLLTFDLDARLAERRHQNYACNLAVVSHYGLTLPSDVATYFALDSNLSFSFRDIYQTSLFCSVLSAIKHLPPPPPYATVSEIGRGVVIDLEREERGVPASAPVKSVAGFAQVPDAGGAARTLHAGGYGPKLVALLIVIAAAAGLARFARRSHEALPALRRVLAPTSARAKLVLIGCLIVVAWFVRDAVLHRAELGREPSELFKGASVWPTLAVRLFLSVCAYAAIAHNVRRRTAMGRIARTQVPERREKGDASSNFEQACSRVAPATGSDPLAATLVFAAIGAVLAFVTMLALAGSAPEAPPVRGEFLYRVERTVFFLALAAVGSIVAYVTWVAILILRLRWCIAPDPEPSTNVLEAAGSGADARNEASRGAKNLHRVGTVLGACAHTSSICVMALLLLVANAPHLDGWSFPPVLLLAVGSAIVVGAVGDLILHSAAQAARRAALEPLQHKLLEGGYAENEDPRRIATQAHEIAAFAGDGFGSLWTRPTLCVAVAVSVIYLLGKLADGAILANVVARL